MNFDKLIHGPIWNEIRKVVPGVRKITIPGLNGVWFDKEGDNATMVVSQQDNGMFSITVSIGNINIGNEQFLVEDPNDIVTIVSEKYAEWISHPVEGRTVSRGEYAEMLEGTLTGKDLSLLQDDFSEKGQILEDAVESIDEPMLTL